MKSFLSFIRLQRRRQRGARTWPTSAAVYDRSHRQQGNFAATWSMQWYGYSNPARREQVPGSTRHPGHYPANRAPNGIDLKWHQARGHLLHGLEKEKTSIDGSIQSSADKVDGPLWASEQRPMCIHMLYMPGGSDRAGPTANGGSRRGTYKYSVIPVNANRFAKSRI